MFEHLLSCESPCARLLPVRPHTVSGPEELEAQVVVSYHVSAENETGIPDKLRVLSYPGWLHFICVFKDISQQQ